MSLFAGPVCCEPRHRRVDDVVCRSVSTLKADILNIIYDCYSENNNVQMAALLNLINGDDFLFSFAVDEKKTKNNSVLTEKCRYLNLRSKVHTQLR